jgi:hypothetical protein
MSKLDIYSPAVRGGDAVIILFTFALNIDGEWVES